MAVDVWPTIDISVDDACLVVSIEDAGKLVFREDEDWRVDIGESLVAKTFVVCEDLSIVDWPNVDICVKTVEDFFGDVVSEDEDWLVDIDESVDVVTFVVCENEALSVDDWPTVDISGDDVCFVVSLDDGYK